MQNKKIFTFLLLALISAAALVGCTTPYDWKINDGKSARVEKNSTTSKTAKYKITLLAEWSSETHPDFYPSNAHFSPFVAYSHIDLPSAQIFKVGETPSPGIEEMAETGATELLVGEIQKIIDSNSAHAQTKGSVFNSPGHSSSELELTQHYSNITFVSMLAPSPDWFVAQTIDLFEDGEWAHQVKVDLTTYDAGSDSGLELTSPDQDTNPKEPITIFNDNLQNLGKLIITRISE